MIIHADVLTILSYTLAAIFAIIVGFILKIPLLPEKPRRESWTISIIFPTVVISLGLSAMVFEMGWNGIIVGSAIGIISAIISKYFLESILPRPKEPVEGDS
jgi:energy-converting hydrogenase A subunit A